jgi:Asp-tRNA(Asn)/Glu-tRNA(Gln) amidotransferase A subunit family amidase
VAIGSTVTALEVLAGEKLRSYIFEYTNELFAKERLSAIITPTIGIDVPILSEEAKVIGESDTSMSLLVLRHISFVNFLGLPAYSLPIGFLPPKEKYLKEKEDLVLPVGIHLIGDHWSEDKVSCFRQVKLFRFFILFFVASENRECN